ncbi:ketoacyl-ACP synthase III [Cyanobium sp. HWJ4-Hawea]|uniref:beta-ketoacyl-ACP synthase III n=1 Tax=unclassified Cyanobium TaxID=2627006 RepID=UPI0020CEDD66|nr:MULTISPECIES: beta-ketoacyl-ACP synthase III [unclassified Cyanobium]MCP9775323.1 ketoacyl-ACP synthase III [Cyanobium sp. WAJ14-Wanaka]MCP9810074.1 ketoacyl-ACP synthase III [Cyanobium sp. HWJ4-Hawea]
MALVGSGSAVPAASISNTQLSSRVDTNDDWIRSRTGIAARRVAGPSESLTVLATRAAQAALDHAGWTAEDLDLILLATSSPDDLFGTAPRVQGALGAKNAVAFDLTAACSGFLFSLITASQYLASGAMRRALVIGADQLSRWVDWDDRSTCVLFGDGAAAVAVEACPSSENGLLGFRMRSDGSRNGCLTLAQIPSHEPLIEGLSAQKGGFAPIQMNGQEVYKFAVREVPAILAELLEATGTSADQLQWLLLHQANQRILDAVADRFSMPHEQVLSNLSHYGNTSAATIPLMLDEAVKDGRVQSGHLLASSGFGAGLSWGAALLRWSGPQG